MKLKLLILSTTLLLLVITLFVTFFDDGFITKGIKLASLCVAIAVVYKKFDKAVQDW